MIPSLPVLTLLASPMQVRLSPAESKAFIVGQSEERTSGRGHAREFLGGRRAAREDLDGGRNPDPVFTKSGAV
jgi:hypothetical protein